MEYLQYCLVMWTYVVLLDVLNLIINGIPSIHPIISSPSRTICIVLNLIINGIPSILLLDTIVQQVLLVVLNLIINGIPSILIGVWLIYEKTRCFKPYYKWNTFNTIILFKVSLCSIPVLNLIINGIPSIL